MKTIWPRRQLAEVIDIASGQVDPTLPPYSEMPHIGGDNIRSGSGELHDLSTAKALGLTSGKYLFSKLDVLYSKIRPNLNKIALPNFSGICSADIYPITPRLEHIDRIYLYFLLMSPGFLDYAISHSTRTNIPKINRESLLSYEFPLPPLPEQRRIATILDQADALRAKRRKAISWCHELVQSLFAEAFGDPATNSREWETARLETVCDDINDCPHTTPTWTDYGVICLRTSNLAAGEWNWDDTRYVSDAAFHERSKRGYIRPGDIILSREGTVGIAAIVSEDMTVCMGQRLVQVRPSASKLDPEYLLRFLLYVLAPNRISRLMVGSTSQHLNLKDLRALRIPIPPLAIQHRFAVQMRKFARLRNAYERSLAKLDELFASLQHRAFRGELTSGDLRQFESAAGQAPVGTGAAR